MSARWIWGGRKPTYEARRAEMALTNLISYKSEWNNSVIKFGALIYLEFIALFYWICVGIT